MRIGSGDHLSGWLYRGCVDVEILGIEAGQPAQRRHVGHGHGSVLGLDRAFGAQLLHRAIHLDVRQT